jgi:hypothetical protein
MKYSATAILIILVVFIIFLLQAYYEDQSYYEHHSDKSKCPACQQIVLSGNVTDPENFHKAVVETMAYEHQYGRFAESKVKKVLISARDQIIRGILMGALEGSAVSALQGAVAWSLTGGIISGASNLFGWKTKFI